MDRRIGFFLFDQPLGIRSVWDIVRTKFNLNKILLKEDLKNFHMLLNVEVPEFKLLLFDQVLYDASISLVVPQSMFDHFVPFYLSLSHQILSIS